MMCPLWVHKGGVLWPRQGQAGMPPQRGQCLAEFSGLSQAVEDGKESTEHKIWDLILLSRISGTVLTRQQKQHLILLRHPPQPPPPPHSTSPRASQKQLFTLVISASVGTQPSTQDRDCAERSWGRAQLGSLSTLGRVVASNISHDSNIDFAGFLQRSGLLTSTHWLCIDALKHGGGGGAMFFYEAVTDLLISF